MWRDIRPYLGHCLLGMAIGCAVATAAITLVASAFGVSGETFSNLSVWVFLLIIVMIVTGCAGVLLYMSPWARKEWHARHAERPAPGR